MFTHIKKEKDIINTSIRGATYGYCFINIKYEMNLFQTIMMYSS